MTFAGLAVMPPLLIVAAALYGRRLWKEADRLRPGLCPACGYDLRATPGRCPECGAEVAFPRPAPLRGRIEAA